jgi:voltage-gated potassium channel
MLALILTAVLLVAATVAIHAFGTTYWIRYLAYRYAGPDGNFKANAALPAIAWTALVLLTLHEIEVVLWALAYLLLLPGDHLDTFEKATYFSVVTFTTLGYGDITLVEHNWRLLSGIESLDGILLVGWTTALLFMVVQRSWRSMAHGH